MEYRSCPSTYDGFDLSDTSPFDFFYNGGLSREVVTGTRISHNRGTEGSVSI